MRPCQSATEAADSIQRSSLLILFFDPCRKRASTLSLCFHGGTIALGWERIVGDYGKPPSLWTGGRSEVPPFAMTERSSQNNHPSVPSVLFSSHRYTSRTNYKVVGRMRPINHSRAMKTCPGIWPATIFIESYIDIFFMMNFFLILFIFDIISKLNVLLNDLEIHNDFAMKNKKNWEWLEMNFYNKKD